MPELPEVYPPLDLTRYTEATRRALYDAVVAVQFAPEPDAGPDDYQGPSYTPDEAGLAVFWAFGRWFAVWADLDEPNATEVDVQTVILQIIAARSRPYGLHFQEV